MQIILFILNELDDISFDRMVLKIVDSLDKKRLTPYVYSLKENGMLYKEFKARLGDNFYTSSGSVLIDSIKIAQFIVKHPKCIIQTPALRSDYAVFLARAILLGLVPFYHIAVRHNYLFREKNIYHFSKNILYFFSIRLVSMNICVARHIEKGIMDQLKLSQNKLITIPNGVRYMPDKRRSKRILRLLSLPKRTPIIIYTGSFDFRKNLTYLLRVLSEINKDFFCILVGRGPEKEKLERCIINKDLEGKVILIDYQKNIYDYLAISDIFVMPSIDEGLSLSIIEAMQAGLACAVSDIPGNRELIDDAKDGFLFPLDDLHSCVQLLSQMIGDDKLRQMIGKKAQKKANNLYQESRMIRNYKNLYNSISLKFL